MLSTFTTIFTLLPPLYNRNVECYPLLQQYLPCYLLYIIEMLNVIHFTTIFTLIPALYNRNVECYPLLQQYLPCYLLYIIEMLNVIHFYNNIYLATSFI